MSRDNGSKRLYGEGILLNPKPTKEMIEHLKKIRLLSNQHLLNEDRTDIKPSAIVKQSLNDFQ